MITSEFAAIAPVILLVAAVFEIVPRLRKRNLYFGVTVTPEFRDSSDGRGIAMRFRLILWAGSAAALVAAWIGSEIGNRALLGLSPMIQVFSVMGAWVWAWKATRPYAASVSGERSAELVAAREPLPGGVLTMLSPFLGPLAAATWLAVAWDDLPARFPAHYGLDGQPDRWVEKSPAAVFFNPVMSALTLSLMAAGALMILYGSRRGSSGEREGWASRYRALNVRLLVAVMWMASALTSLVSVGALIPSSVLAWALPVVGVGMIAAIVAFAIPLIRMSMESTGGSDATPDECWKLGLFYVNPADPAFIVEKRDGIGYTLNFGNRMTWGILVLIGLIVFFPMYFMRLVNAA
jgi:uncharacterized membrane protein